MIQDILGQLDFSEKEVHVYLALLEKGQVSVRTLAEITKIGRGTVYNILNQLVEKGVVTKADRGKIKYFTAEDPEKLLHTFALQRKKLEEAEKTYVTVLPELQELYGDNRFRPKVTYFVGQTGIKQVLEDILFTMQKEKEKLVYTYSSAELRGVVYAAFPEYTARRIDAEIKTKVIKLGRGGVISGLDEVREMPPDRKLRTYTHIYGNKVSYITSSSSGYIMSAVIENENIAQTQKFLFEGLWEYLPEPPLPHEQPSEFNR